MRTSIHHPANAKLGSLTLDVSAQLVLRHAFKFAWLAPFLTLDHKTIQLTYVHVSAARNTESRRIAESFTLLGNPKEIGGQARDSDFGQGGSTLLNLGKAGGHVIVSYHPMGIVLPFLNARPAPHSGAEECFFPRA